MANNISDKISVSGEAWTETAKIYKNLTEGTSIKPNTVMLQKANSLLPFSRATGIYDNGCGTGLVLSRIIEDFGAEIPESATLECSDFSPAMVEEVESLKKEEVEKGNSALWGRVEARVRNAMDLEGVRDGSMSHVSAGWVYFMTPNPQTCLSESKRILAPNGVLCCSSWKSNEWMNMTQLLLKRLRPDVQLPGIPAEWAGVVPLENELKKAGFREVHAEEVDVEMEFDTYDHFIDTMMTKVPIMVQLTKDFSQEERAKLRQLFLERLREVSPKEPGALPGTALVVVGRK